MCAHDSDRTHMKKIGACGTRAAALIQHRFASHPDNNNDDGDDKTMSDNEADVKQAEERTEEDERVEAETAERAALLAKYAAEFGERDAVTEREVVDELTTNRNMDSPFVHALLDKLWPGKDGVTHWQTLALAFAANDRDARMTAALHRAMSAPFNVDDSVADAMVLACADEAIRHGKRLALCALLEDQQLASHLSGRTLQRIAKHVRELIGQIQNEQKSDEKRLVYFDQTALDQLAAMLDGGGLALMANALRSADTYYTRMRLVLDLSKQAAANGRDADNQFDKMEASTASQQAELAGVHLDRARHQAAAMRSELDKLLRVHHFLREQRTAALEQQRNDLVAELLQSAGEQASAELDEDADINDKELASDVRDKQRAVYELKNELEQLAQRGALMEKWTSAANDNKEPVDASAVDRAAAELVSAIEQYADVRSRQLRGVSQRMQTATNDRLEALASIRQEQVSAEIDAINNVDPDSYF
jgi:hypothetical protein